ncbi:MAG: aminotransferase class V-fold PLP-dependent enzyme [Burkholderiales bacterium]|nr:aminotransferase class V-fold PLP-dependent enzyme [Burkholderiales bacterium]
MVGSTRHTDTDDFTPSEIAAFRAETPGCRSVVHLNNAGAALVAKPVLDKHVAHLQREADIGAYEAARAAAGEVRAVYRAFAELLGCSPQEVALAPNATWAWSQAFLAMPLQSGDRILTAQSEYVSNYLAYLKRAKEVGATIDVIPNDEYGQIDTNALLRAIDERVKLISLPHVPTNGGLINPVAEVGRIARAHGIPFLLDACQSVGHLCVNVDEVGCDILATTSRKFLRGPRGMGCLYVRKRWIERLEPPVFDPQGAQWVSSDQYLLRPDACRYETWEYSVAAALALGEAVRRANAIGLPRIERRLVGLAATLRGNLNAIENVTVHDLGAHKGAIVTFDVNGLPAEAAMAALIARGFNVNITKPAFTMLDMSRRNLPDLVRASVHYYNTDEEIDAFCAEVATLARAPQHE